MIQGFPTNAAADLAVSKPGKVLRELQREYLSPETMRCRAGQQDIKLVVEPAGSIEGKVVAQETGQPLAGMRLLLQASRPGYAGGVEREPAQSGTDGAFRLADVAAGSYQIHAVFWHQQSTGMGGRDGHRDGGIRPGLARCAGSRLLGAASWK